MLLLLQVPPGQRLPQTRLFSQVVIGQRDVFKQPLVSPCLHCCWGCLPITLTADRGLLLLLLLLLLLFCQPGQFGRLLGCFRGLQLKLPLLLVVELLALSSSSSSGGSLSSGSSLSCSSCCRCCICACCAAAVCAGVGTGCLCCCLLLGTSPVGKTGQEGALQQQQDHSRTAAGP